MEEINALFHGFSVALSPFNLMLMFIGVILGVNMQTSFMHPPFGFALFYLRGVAPKEVKSSDIYWGAVPFVILQLIMVALVVAMPKMVTVFLDKDLKIDLDKVKIELPTDSGGSDSPSGATDEEKEKKDQADQDRRGGGQQVRREPEGAGQDQAGQQRSDPGAAGAQDRAACTGRTGGGRGG